MAGGDAALWQVVLGMATTVVGIVGLTLLAGRVYANAALRLGTRMSFRDALRGEAGLDPYK
jgi:ABC-2 type transport system permease protein